ncbi:MAG: type II toxin-antitoxin system RelE/ParE family toxin [Gammaproteobacteria bacterium]
MLVWLTVTEWLDALAKGERKAMPTVAWLPEALEDVARLYDFLADKNPHAAANAIRCIQAAAHLPAQYAEAGKPMEDDSGRREIFAVQPRYVRDPHDCGSRLTHPAPSTQSCAL